MTRILILAVVFAGGCKLSNTLPKNECHTDADCNPGNTCQGGICVGPGGGTGGGGGGCGGFPPPACDNDPGNVLPLDLSGVQSLLPGRWIWCTGDNYVGQPFVIGPDGNIGFEFNADATLWWLLYDDGHGVPTHRDGFGAGGTVEFVAGSSGPQVNLVTETSWYTLLASISDGPPRHLRLISGGPSAYYVQAAGACAGPLQPGYDGGTYEGAFGGMCDANDVRPNSCPSAGGVACSICAAMELGAHCLQPCKKAEGGCASGQSCGALPYSYVMAGDCMGFDGYCQ